MFGISSSQPPTLIPVGPFAGMSAQGINNLSVISVNRTLPAATRTTPLKYNTVTFLANTASNIRLSAASSGSRSAIWIWADTMNWGGNGSGGLSIIDNSAIGGDDAQSFDAGNGGFCFSGGSGGGGGSVIDSEGIVDGGTFPPIEIDGANGSAGGIGDNGQNFSSFGSEGQGGFSNGNTTAVGFTMPSGGYSLDAFGGLAVNGGQGFGAGGQGGGVNVTNFDPDNPEPYWFYAGGGGGGGGGAIVIVTRILNLTNYAGCTATGGNGGRPDRGDGGVATFQDLESTGGGGGVIMIYAKKKAGVWNTITVGGGQSTFFTYTSGPGTIQLWEIGSDNVTLTQHTNLNDTWDNT